jgi:hypothetical protein
MSRFDTIVSAEAWTRMVRDLKALGPNPEQAKVVSVVVDALWDIEGITLDEDHR